MRLFVLTHTHSALAARCSGDPRQLRFCPKFSNNLSGKVQN